METAIYHDFELRKKKGRNKREEEAPIGANSEPGGNGAGAVEAVRGSGVQESVQVPEETVTVMRVCANPRLVVCVYDEDGIEKRVLVKTKRNGNFRSGMRFKAVRSTKAGEPWEYRGRQPRFPGRW